MRNLYDVKMRNERKKEEDGWRVERDDEEDEEDEEQHNEIVDEIIAVRCFYVGTMAHLEDDGWSGRNEELRQNGKTSTLERLFEITIERVVELNPLKRS